MFRKSIVKQCRKLVNNSAKHHRWVGVRISPTHPSSKSCCVEHLGFTSLRLYWSTPTPHPLIEGWNFLAFPLTSFPFLWSEQFLRSVNQQADWISTIPLSWKSTVLSLETQDFSSQSAVVVCAPQLVNGDHVGNNTVGFFPSSQGASGKAWWEVWILFPTQE